MKILVVVNFRDYTKPNQNSGVYGLITEDESVLAFNGVNRQELPYDDLHSKMGNFFFSEYRKAKVDHKFPSLVYLNKSFTRMLVMTKNLPAYDKIVFCDA